MTFKDYICLKAKQSKVIHLTALERMLTRGVDRVNQPERMSACLCGENTLLTQHTAYST